MADPRKQEYAVRYRCQFLGALGAGVGQDGYVLRSDRASAVKFFDRLDRFQRELEVYHILQAKNIEKIAGHNVPRFIRADAELRAIEMFIVEPPFVLDFAGAKLPREVPDFEQHTLDEHAAHLMELFEDHYADAMHVVEMFRRATGYVLLDIHPGNIAFAE